MERVIGREREENSRPNGLLYAVLAGLAVYLILFLASPYEWSGEHKITRGGYLAPMVLLPDEIVGEWLNSPSDLLPVDRILPLAMAVAICTVSGMLGHLALVALQIERKLSTLETIFFAEAVGLNLVSTYTLAVGLLGALHHRLWFIAPAIVVAAGWVWILRHRDRRKTDRPLPAGTEPPHGEIRWLNHHWLWLGGAFVLVILLGGLLPPNEFDVREYHLEAPKEFYAAGRIGFLPHNLYGNMTLGTEMHALLGMVLAGDWWTGALVGKAIIALFAPLTALGLLTAGRRFFSSSAGVLAAVAYISIPLIANISTVGFIEGAAALYLFATLYAMLLVQSDREANAVHWLLPGYMAGASVACKYPGLLFVVAPLGTWLLWLSLARRDADGRRNPDRLAPVVFGFAVFLGCGLWLAKNWILTGNPLYPLLFGLFGGETLTAEKVRMWNEVHEPAGFTFSALLADARRVLLSSDWLSPILIPLAALAFFHQRRPLVLGLAVYFAFIVAAWWCLALRIDRYWAPALPILALLAGAGATWCEARLWQYSLLGLLIFSSLVNFITAATSPCIYPPLFVPYATLRTAPDRVNPWHLYLNANAEGTVLLVGEAQVFDLEVSILYNTWLDDSVFESIFRDPASEGLRPADEICVELKSRDISHLYVAWSEIGRYIDTGYGNWDFVRPEVFQQLVADGVLQRIPPPEGLEESVNQVYRVVWYQR
jgi:hypothetical protein